VRAARRRVGAVDVDARGRRSRGPRSRGHARPCLPIPAARYGVAAVALLVLIAWIT
jgi:hypothetical protein